MILASQDLTKLLTLNIYLLFPSGPQLLVYKKASCAPVIKLKLLWPLGANLTALKWARVSLLWCDHMQIFDHLVHSCQVSFIRWHSISGFCLQNSHCDVNPLPNRELYFWLKAYLSELSGLFLSSFDYTVY